MGFLYEILVKLALNSLMHGGFWFRADLHISFLLSSLAEVFCLIKKTTCMRSTENPNSLEGVEHEETSRCMYHSAQTSHNRPPSPLF